MDGPAFFGFGCDMAARTGAVDGIGTSQAIGAADPSADVVTGAVVPPGCSNKVT